MELCKLNLTEWGHAFRRKKEDVHHSLFFPSKNITILNQSRWLFAYSYALNTSSCQNHLSQKNIHCRSQTLMSIVCKVGSSAISETLLISAVQLQFLEKQIFSSCRVFWTWNYSFNFCRLDLSEEYNLEEYMRYPKSNTSEYYT